jgi:hypothetical protein
VDKQELIDALVAVDRARPRSRQKAIGVSALGGCRRSVWHSIQGDEGTNPTTSLPAIMGTAIHAAIEQAFSGKPGVLLEERVEVPNLPPATIDYFNTDTGEVVDWKTITLRGLDYFVSKQKRWQIQTYGYLLTQVGHKVNTVTLVGIPRDGNENDIVVYSEAYDEAVALEALAWLDSIREGQVPEPERDPVSWCKKYCQFYGSQCAGKAADVSGEAITDGDATDAARNYVKLSAEIRTLEAAKESAKTALEGVNGITMDGIKVSWSEIAGRQTPDQDAIKVALGEIPMKVGSPSIRLTVK